MIADSNRPAHSAPYSMSEFFYMDAETARKRKDQQTIAFLETLKNKDG